jgi:D-alanine-D-alanine ligase
MGVSVAVLAGGLSLERDVSLRSGRRVAEALASRGHRVTRLDLDDGLVTAVATGDFDVAYLALHGKAGEDGTIQGLLDVLGLTFTGSDAVASALAWDKAVFKGLARREGLATPDWIAVSSDAVRNMGAGQTLDRVVARLGLPLVVKPSQGGAAMGVRVVHAAAELGPALMTGFSYHDHVVVERFVAGTEIAVSILDHEPLPAVEIVPRDGAAYDFAARYTHGATDFYVPARLGDAVLVRAQDLALRAYDLAGCRHVARVDMIVDTDGQPWLLELDTCPGMTETSLLPVSANSAGLAFPDLVDRIVRLAVTAHAPV